MKRILFTGVGRRIELLQAFRNAALVLNKELKIYGADMAGTAPALAYCDYTRKVVAINAFKVENEEELEVYAAQVEDYIVQPFHARYLCRILLTTVWTRYYQDLLKSGQHSNQPLVPTFQQPTSPFGRLRLPLGPLRLLPLRDDNHTRFAQVLIHLNHSWLSSRDLDTHIFQSAYIPFLNHRSYILNPLYVR